MTRPTGTKEQARQQKAREDHLRPDREAPGSMPASALVEELGAVDLHRNHVFQVGSAARQRADRRAVERTPPRSDQSLKGAQIRFHAAWLYSWMRPPSRSRRSIAAVGRGTEWSLHAEGSGGLRFSERCGLWLL